MLSVRSAPSRYVARIPCRAAAKRAAAATRAALRGKWSFASAALSAERQGKPQVLEKHLRHLLKLKPEHAHALNALGYSFAERNMRLDEAKKLITRALALAPEDPFIMDSMGWVLFRQGKLPEALKTLETAYGIKADPEIAVHIGEVLWTLGRKDEASRFMMEAARKFPDSEILAGALKKFQP